MLLIWEVTIHLIKITAVRETIFIRSRGNNAVKMRGNYSPDKDNSSETIFIRSRGNNVVNMRGNYSPDKDNSSERDNFY